MEKYEKTELKQLLEVIEHNLGFNLDSIYSQAIQLINSDNTDDLKQKLLLKKTDFKNQIHKYLITVVKNIVYQMRMINPNNFYMMQTIQRLEKAIK